MAGNLSACTMSAGKSGPAVSPASASRGCTRPAARSPKNALAAGAAWFIATEALGHPQTVLRPDRGDRLARDHRGRAHTRRAIELSIGVTLGILVADLLVHAIGRGTVSLMVVVAFAMSAAVLVGGGNLLVRQSARSTSAVLVATLATTGSPFSRSIDALVGCAVALVMAGFLVLPGQPARDPAPRSRPRAHGAGGRARRRRRGAARARPRPRGGGQPSHADAGSSRSWRASATPWTSATRRCASPRRAGARAPTSTATPRPRRGSRPRCATRASSPAPPAAPSTRATTCRPRLIEAITDLAEAARALGPGLPEGTGEERARAATMRCAALGDGRPRADEQPVVERHRRPSCARPRSISCAEWVRSRTRRAQRCAERSPKGDHEARARAPSSVGKAADRALSPQTKQAGARIAGLKVTESVCPYCAVGCGQLVYTRGGELVDIEGNPRSPINQGTLCPKGSASRQLVQQPGRLTQGPATAARAAPSGRSSSSSTAMDMIAERVIAARENGWQDTDHHGRRVDRTLGFAHLGGATLDNEENYLIKKAFTAMGAVQIENQARI